MSNMPKIKSSIDIYIMHDGSYQFYFPENIDLNTKIDALSTALDYMTEIQEQMLAKDSEGNLLS